MSSMSVAMPWRWWQHGGLGLSMRGLPWAPALVTTSRPIWRIASATTGDLMRYGPTDGAARAMSGGLRHRTTGSCAVFWVWRVRRSALVSSTRPSGVDYSSVNLIRQGFPTPCEPVRRGRGRGGSSIGWRAEPADGS